MLAKIPFSLVPGVGGWTESDNVIGVGACEGTGGVIIRVAVSEWARALEELRI